MKLGRNIIIKRIYLSIEKMSTLNQMTKQKERMWIIRKFHGQIIMLTIIPSLVAMALIKMYVGTPSPVEFYA